MAIWTDITYGTGSILTSDKMTELDANFDAMAEGAVGAPLFKFESIDRVSSWTNVSSGGSVLGRINFATQTWDNPALLYHQSGVLIDESLSSWTRRAKQMIYIPDDAINLSYRVKGRGGSLSRLTIEGVASSTGSQVSLPTIAQFQWSELSSLGVLSVNSYVGWTEIYMEVTYVNSTDGWLFEVDGFYTG